MIEYTERLDWEHYETDELETRSGDTLTGNVNQWEFNGLWDGWIHNVSQSQVIEHCENFPTKEASMEWVNEQLVKHGVVVVDEEPTTSDIVANCWLSPDDGEDFPTKEAAMKWADEQLVKRSVIVVEFTKQQDRERYATAQFRTKFGDVLSAQVIRSEFSGEWDGWIYDDTKRRTIDYLIGSPTKENVMKWVDEQLTRRCVAVVGKEPPDVFAVKVNGKTYWTGGHSGWEGIPQYLYDALVRYQKECSDD